ncbi:UNVERIFIED_CONTAM: hypothetical protein GTU68_008615, partial [Idotea baltica]|nr:hypothetical protein [Idotea baltica]
QLILYHNPNCSKSCQALSILQSKNITPILRYYLDKPLNIFEIKSLIRKLDYKAQELIRKNDALYKSLKLDDPKTEDIQFINAMIQHPQLIERPILESPKKAIVGRPPEKILEILT